MFFNIKLDQIAEVLLKKRALFAFLTIAIGGVVSFGIRDYQLATSVDSIMAQGDKYKAEVDQARNDFPGSPSALVWPQEWSIIVFWIILGALLFGLSRLSNRAD